MTAPIIKIRQIMVTIFFSYARIQMNDKTQAIYLFIPYEYQIYPKHTNFTSRHVGLILYFIKIILFCYHKFIF